MDGRIASVTATEAIFCCRCLRRRIRRRALHQLSPDLSAISRVYTGDWVYQCVNVAAFTSYRVNPITAVARRRFVDSR